MQVFNKGAALVLIESPYAGDVERNEHYLSRCLRDSLLRGEAPYASHALYTRSGVLDDLTPADRKAGIDAGHAWLRAVNKVACYRDHGVSEGMALGLARAEHARVPVEIRIIGQSVRCRACGELGVIWLCDACAPAHFAKPRQPFGLALMRWIFGGKP